MSHSMQLSLQIVVHLFSVPKWCTSRIYSRSSTVLLFLSFNLYADDAQLYIHLQPQNEHHLLSNLTDIKKTF